MGLLAALALATGVLAFGGLATIADLALASACAAHHITSTEESAGQADSGPIL
jgi:hypothetical protein